jgi:hypothetical protein
VKTAVPANWVGGFMGYNQGEIIGCAYDKSRNANWEAVDVILYDAPSDVVDIADEAVSE